MNIQKMIEECCEKTSLTLTDFLSGELKDDDATKVILARMFTNQMVTLECFNVLFEMIEKWSRGNRD